MIKLLDIIIIIEQCQNDMEKRNQHIMMIDYCCFFIIYLFALYIFLKKVSEMKFGILFDSVLLSSILDFLVCVPFGAIFAMCKKRKKSLKLDNKIEDQLVGSFLEEYHELKNKKDLSETEEKIINSYKNRIFTIKSKKRANVWG